MKRIVVIAGLFLAFIFGIHAQEYDTLKLKTIKTVYGFVEEKVFYTVGYLDGAVININTLPLFYPGIVLVNVSNDTFPSDETYGVELFYEVCADTGVIAGIYDLGPFFGHNPFLPNDTMRVALGLGIDLLRLIDHAGELEGFDFEDISYWRMFIGIGYTVKDGRYSKKVYYAGSDTSIFYVVNTPVNIQEKEKEVSLISVFPNPARSQFTVTNVENASLQLYNMAGQEVLRTYSKEENTVVNVDLLPQGIYVLKVLKGGIFSTYKVVVDTKSN
jgi:hypothetical protein